jgi:peroxiredoxin Q/BCP
MRVSDESNQSSEELTTTMATAMAMRKTKRNQGPGDPAPDFSLVDTNGRTVRLSDYRGRPVVLVFARGFR